VGVHTHVKMSIRHHSVGESKKVTGYYSRHLHISFKVKTKTF